MFEQPVVSDFMDREFVRLDPEMKLSDAVGILLKENLLAALVVDKNSQLIGILSEKDCLRELLHRGYNQMPLGKVRDYMHDAPEPVSPSLPISELTQLFAGMQHRRVPVMESDELVGQITRRDVMCGYHRLLTKNPEWKSHASG